MIVNIYNQDQSSKIITKVTWRQYQDSLWILINTVPTNLNMVYAHNTPYPYSYVALSGNGYGEVRFYSENEDEKRILKGISTTIYNGVNIELLILAKDYFKPVKTNVVQA